MTTQEITDYITKQIFIERNIVTFRSLSRQFSIHVNVAKNELATFHHNAPYQSQNCSATFLLSGSVRTIRHYKDADEDVDMEDEPFTSQVDEESDDGDEVPQMKFTIVNERDLEDAKAAYAKLHSIHVYSLSPSPIHDAGLLCAPTEGVRNVDKVGGVDWAGKVGRVVGTGIQMKGSKKGKQPVQPVAGPSKLKQPSESRIAPVTKVVARDADAQEKSNDAATDKGKEKPKATGKIGFFKAKAKETKETREVKQEEPVKDVKKKMFFTKPPSRAPSVASEKAESETPAVPVRGIKRKSSIGLEPEPRERTPENPAISKPQHKARVKGRVVLSDDDEDTMVQSRFRRRSTADSRSVSVANSEAEREAMALMDIDDDLVEKVSREASAKPPATTDDEEQETDVSVVCKNEEDVDMADESAVAPKIRKKREKKVVPIGSNGLKKKKVTKTRRALDENGYMRNEDYSDWESVDENAEPEPPAPPKVRRKPVVVKEDGNPDVPPPPAPKEVEATANKTVPKTTTAPAAVKPKPVKKAAGKVKEQKGLLNFFGPKKS
ncbi:DNA polymerase subunit Cdc27 [Crassisporium funariophilum]|nr:DNA polymerase subunit Cdc27 [Crassisporium funariophilum]